MACPEGIEPPTTRLEGECSIQLSYGQMDERPTLWAFSIGRSDRIRTYDPLVPNQMRYQTALRSEAAILASPLAIPSPASTERRFRRRGPGSSVSLRLIKLQRLRRPDT